MYADLFSVSECGASQYRYFSLFCCLFGIHVKFYQNNHRKCVHYNILSVINGLFAKEKELKEKMGNCRSPRAHKMSDQHSECIANERPFSFQLALMTLPAIHHATKIEIRERNERVMRRRFKVK